MKRKKPIGDEFESFVKRWHDSDHYGKLDLASKYGASFDSCKHWVSEEGRAKPRTQNATSKPQSNPQREEAILADSVKEIMEIQPRVHLDFCCFDIETTNLTADFSILLTATIKPYGCPPTVFRADDYPAWYKDRKNDSEICEDIANELGKHAVVVTHYGSGFDIPYLRAKMIKYGLNPLPPMYGVDTYRLAKANLRVSSKRLENLCRYFELGSKSGVEGNLWLEAGVNGSRVAMDSVLAHNVQDVVLLERLAAMLFPYSKNLRRI